MFLKCSSYRSTVEEGLTKHMNAQMVESGFQVKSNSCQLAKQQQHAGMLCEPWVHHIIIRNYLCKRYARHKSQVHKIMVLIRSIFVLG